MPTGAVEWQTASSTTVGALHEAPVTRRRPPPWTGGWDTATKTSVGRDDPGPPDPVVWGKRAEQSPAPTNIIVPLHNQRRPFPAYRRDTGRRGRRPLRRAGRLLCHQRRLPSNPPPGGAGHIGAALRRNRAHPQPTNPFNYYCRDTARRGRRALRITGAGPSTDGAPLRCKSAARTFRRLAAQ